MRLRGYFDPPSLRAAWWARRAVQQARRQLAAHGIEGLAIQAPPGLPPGAARGVDAVLRRLDPTCLERAVVRQRWLAAQGIAREVVIGVTAPGEEFTAHAWLDGEPAGGPESLRELARIPAP